MTLFELEAPMSDTRVDALASVIAGFIAPGYNNWAAVPQRVRKPCVEAARQALDHVQQTIPPEHRSPNPGGAS